MNRYFFLKAVCFPVFTFLLVTACVQQDKIIPFESSEERNGIPFLDNYRLIGTVSPRHASEIKASNWSVGAEMMDRDFTIYNHWKDYLGPLGVKKARIQSGWAKTEKEKGMYSWEWLDEIVFDVVKQDVEPWIDLCYGNPIYSDGGGTLLNAAIPKSANAMEGWLNYVSAIVHRYGKHVKLWEIWNEPNYRIDATDYAYFMMSTARAIRKELPDARIIGIAIGSGVNYQYVDAVLKVVEENSGIDLIDEIAHHRHIPIPEKRNPEIELEKVVRKYSERITIRQGEAGCPSEFSTQFALNNYPWTEKSQAKHILRRMLTDLGYNKESCCFTIMDAKDEPKGWNRKGLLKSAEDQTVEYPKPAYFAMQHLTSVFDDTIEREKEIDYTVEKPDSCQLSIYSYTKTKTGRKLFTIWQEGNIPTEEYNYTTCHFTFPDVTFTNPVYVDMISGCVYEIPEKDIETNNKQYSIKNIPVFDYPILIADRNIIKMKKK